MEKLLIMGINTRGLVNSCLNLPYHPYSVSYYFTSDSHQLDNEKHLLDQKTKKSCGFFEKNYSPAHLLELASDYLDEVDYIVFAGGISPSDFKGKFKKYRKKILGNIKTDHVENKYKFYRRIKNKYLVPKTFKVNYGNIEDDISETLEIVKQHQNTKFIIKPLQGSGGYGVTYLKYNEENENNFKDFKNKNEQYIDSQYASIYEKYKNCGLIIQEYIKGIDISSSVLSTKKKSKTIINSKILTENDFGVENSFRYCGNIVPLNINPTNNKNNTYDVASIKINPNNNKNNVYNISKINDISEEIISQLKLVGSNGVDMILSNDSKENDDPYIIEVNPRFQGTYESVEELLGINLLDAHIKACKGELIEIPKAKKGEFSIKRIIYSKNRIKVGNIKKGQNIYDIPLKGTIIEEAEPMVTIITPKNNFKYCEDLIKISMEDINRNISNYHSK
jgi:uncharacterized protein